MLIPRFLFDGMALKDDQVPADVDMEEGDIIDCHHDPSEPPFPSDAHARHHRLEWVAMACHRREPIVYMRVVPSRTVG